MKVLLTVGTVVLVAVGLARMLRSEDEWHEVTGR
ncbi:hypothetical protein RR21198_2765 [Rhodococcus rhodochrous ATCC 21198]|nr:hypothetical protein RR21198_2765 [Rhodococcus rhodochrous ATCC 21198]NCL77094.1 hypothetical protein [Rhodococcus sp. YH1]